MVGVNMIGLWLKLTLKFKCESFAMALCHHNAKIYYQSTWTATNSNICPGRTNIRICISPEWR